MRLFLLLIITISLYHQSLSQQLVIDNQGHSGLVHGLNFIENGKYLLSTSEDKTIRIWDVATGTLNQTLRIQQDQGVFGKIYASAVSHDGRFLFLGGYFAPQNGNPEAIGEIKIIDLSLNKMLTSIKSHSNVVLDLACSEDGKLVSTSADRSIRVWDISTLKNGTKPKSLGGITDLNELVNTLAISPNGSTVAAGDKGGYIRTWQIGASLSSPTKAKVHSEQIQQLTYSLDGSTIYSTGDDGQIIKWTSNGKFLGIMAELPGKVGALALSIDGEQLVAMGRVGVVYDLASETAISQFDYHTNSVSAVTAAPFGSFNQQRGTYMASAGGDNKNILIWETQSGKVVRNLVGQGQSVYGLGIDETSDKIAIGQSNPTGNLDDVALEKIFDFEAFDLGEIEQSSNYHRATKSNNDQYLTKESANSLSFGNHAIYTNPEKDGDLRSYSFTNKGQTITIGSTYSLNRYKTSGEQLGSFKGHTSEIWTIAEHAAKDLLISGSGDQSIKIWNNLTGENLATLFVSTDNEWVIWTPQGYYEASAGGEKYIGWHMNKGSDNLAEFHDVASFSEKFHRRDVVKEMLTLKSFEKVAASMDLKNIEEEVTPPEINWISPNITKSVVMGNETILKFEVTAESPITHIKVMANGRPIVNQTDLNLSGDGNSEALEVTVTLPEGTNNTYTFNLYAEDSNAKVTSMDRTITFESNQSTSTTSSEGMANTKEGERSYLKLDPVEDEQPPSNLYMVSIGVSEFENPDYNLNFAEADANSMANLFENQRGKMFNSVTTFKLVNENATREKILSTFQKLEKYTTVNDFVIIFIASHGMNVDNQFYIVPHDGKADNPRASCIDWRDFSDLVGNMSAKVLLFIDTCHSGQLGNNIGQKAQNNTEAVRKLSGKEYGVVIMAAAKGQEYSLEHPDWGHGAFTLSILEGIEQQKADVKPDGMIFLRELDYYLAERVRELTGGRQHPTTQKPSSISRLKIAHTH